MKKNICIIGLPSNFTKTLAKAVSDSLEMFYADINDMLKFDLLDIKQAQKLAGKQYIQKLETSKIKYIASFENTLMTLNYGSLTNNDNFEIIKKQTLIIYLKMNIETYETLIKLDKLTKSQHSIALSVFKDRDFICKNIADITVNIKSNTLATNIKNIVNAVKEYYAV